MKIPVKMGKHIFNVKDNFPFQFYSIKFYIAIEKRLLILKTQAQDKTLQEMHIYLIFFRNVSLH